MAFCEGVAIYIDLPGCSCCCISRYILNLPAERYHSRVYQVVGSNTGSEMVTRAPDREIHIDKVPQVQWE